MADFQDLAERYIEGFNETDPNRRHTLVEQLYTADARYTDPGVALENRDQIEAFIAGVQQQFPGYTFTVGSAVDAHHSQARLHWNATPPGASDPEYIGFDVLIAEDGQVQRVYGFIDKAPAA
jgi:SnoaL-like domain